MSYEPPIKLHRIVNDIIKDYNDKLEDKVVMSIQQQIGVDVNKEELMHALRYDRDQYKKGYDDGLADGYAKGISDKIAAETAVRDFVNKIYLTDEYRYGSAALKNVIKDILDEMFPHY